MKKITIKNAQIALDKTAPAAEKDHLRPQFHFLSPANWMNDPNGTIYNDGIYHLFYQLNPFEAKWGHCCWGHARSTNLVHWEHLPIALAPDHESKERHCFSGCCVMNGNEPTIFYTSIGGKLGLLNVIRGAQQWAAVGDKDLIHWQRIKGNPVLNQQMHQRRKVYQWRDPYVWKENGEWRMILSGKHFGERYGSVFIYRSQDLKHWEFKGRMYPTRKAVTNNLECPNLLKFEDAHVLIISEMGSKKVHCAIGTLKDYRFTPNQWQTLDHGKDFYATNTYQDDEGYKLLGWLNVPGNGSWRGCMSLPRSIDLDAEQQLIIKPVHQLKTLRGEHIAVINDHASIAGNRLEVVLNFETSGANGEFGVMLEDGTNSYPILLDIAGKTLTCVDEKTSLERLDAVNKLCLHIFIDHSVVEVFVNYHEVMTTWFKPNLEPGESLCLRPVGKALNQGFKMDAWKLKANIFHTSSS